MGSAKSSSVGEAIVSDRNKFLAFLKSRLHSREEAEDVLHEFCVRALDREDQLRTAESMNAWLFSILRSCLSDQFRKSKKIKKLGEELVSDGLVEAQLSKGSDQAMMGEICRCVEALMHDLKPRDAELIRRIDLNEESRESVARSLNITRNALGVRLHRARLDLRDRLLRYCGWCCTHGFEDCSCP